MSLDKQIYIYSIDTSSFYNEGEMKIHNELNKTYHFRNRIKNKAKKNENRDYSKYTLFCNKRIKSLKDSLYEEFTKNNEIRKLNQSALTDKKVISAFESVLSRTLQIPENTLSKDLMVVQTYFFQILEDLIKNGFMYENEKYICFTASAGQIRTKKTMFIKESVWLQHQNTITCGMTVDQINKQGGMNTNKYLAYLALCNSATDEWKGFNINRSIVVEDLETMVNGKVDFINHETFEIERKEMSVPITHTDGCGMILPKKSKKPFMTRLPYVKGLLVPFDFKKFAEIHNKFIVKDIYGKEWNILDDNIEVIFTRSQFKMAKYFKDWNHYKENFIKYNCQAAKCNEEDEIIPNAKINYQMLQSLSDMTIDELTTLASSTIQDIESISSDKDTMLRVLGATKSNKYKNSLQKALELYPALLNDPFSKEIIKSKKKSLVKEAKAGKLNIVGKYTFIIPDMYAFCENLFLGIESPKGLLNNGEVYCNLYKDYRKLDCLRSPHLYLEHSVRNNVIDEIKNEWFITKGLYTSIHDLISRQLQFDCDGDKSLVCADETLIKVAERNMQNVVPLFYEMASANKEIITGESIYNGLQYAYKGNIGIISNDISKIWNSGNVNLEAIKWLTAFNNYVIDYAKTLYLPTIPKDKKKIINTYTRSKVPHFFIYAKDKEENNVESLNDSTVNKLEKIIPDKRINFKKVAGKLDYTLLMKNKDVEINDEIVEKYINLDKGKRWRMKYDESFDNNSSLYIYQLIRNDLLELTDDVEYLVDVLIKYLYEKNSAWKETLWKCFGEIIYSNLQNNLSGMKPCECCGKMIEIKNNRTKYCEKCSGEYQKKWQRESMKKIRNSVKM